MTDTSNIDELIEIASKADPYPWKLWGMMVMSDPVGDSNYETATTIAHTQDVRYFPKPRTFNAHHIAAFDPPTMLELLAELKEARLVHWPDANGCPNCDYMFADDSKSFTLTWEPENVTCEPCRDAFV